MFYSTYNRTFNLSLENICTIAFMTIHYLCTNLNLFYSLQLQTKWEAKNVHRDAARPTTVVVAMTIITRGEEDRGVIGREVGAQEGRVIVCCIFAHQGLELCVQSLGSPWYDYVYFNSASSSIQWVVSLLKWLTKLSVLNVSHYATTKPASSFTEDVLKADLW